MKIDRELVLHVAKLARLELNESEIELFTRQLGDILHYIEKLDEVRQPAEPFSFNTFLPSVLRDDVPIPSLPVEEALRNAPERVKQFFKVPRILP
jgi:aspartyl-tRNA(Asn)/glutamyl-tRNA(Gln) amidotransferase subunit C